jgi:hypothetical protein
LKTIDGGERKFNDDRFELGSTYKIFVMLGGKEVSALIQFDRFGRRKLPVLAHYVESPPILSNGDLIEGSVRMQHQSI